MEEVEGVEWPKLSVMTIALDGTAPRVDLGDITPHAAIAILEVVLSSLRECMLPPVIVFDNEEIYNVYDVDED